jgi:hypothetical protein
MTTVIARPGMVMADTQYTTDYGCEYRSKIFETKGKIWCGSGDISMESVFAGLISSKKTYPKIAWELRNLRTTGVASDDTFGIDAAFVIVGKNVVHYLDTNGAYMVYKDWVTLGSGSKYARAYLENDLFHTAVQPMHLADMAMRMAKKLDPYTGGEIEIRRVGGKR